MALIVVSVDSLLRSLGARLRDARLLREWSLEEVAIRSGVPLSTYRRLERSGEGSLRTLARVAVALGRQAELAALFPVEPARMEDLQTPPTRRRKGRTPSRRLRG